MDKKITYKVSIQTGDLPDAGAACDVYFFLVGDSGETAKIVPAQSNKNFQRSKCDEFTIQEKDVGDLTSVRIGHTNTTRVGLNLPFIARGWFLDSVKVEIGPKVYNFPCYKWISDSKDDKVLERVLQKQDNSQNKRVTYKITTKTADERAAGTDASVGIYLYGNKGETGLLPLDNDNDNFERGKTDIFFVEANDIGTLQRIKIGHDGKDLLPVYKNNDWKLQSVIIEDPRKGQYDFDINAWIGTSTVLWREFSIASAKVGEGKSYTIKIKTGDLKGAGTKAHVFVILHGNKATTQKNFLDNSPNNFDRAAMDVFTIDTIDIGVLSKITIGHDNTGSGPDWFCEHISVLDDSKREYDFPCGRWFSDNQDDNLYIRELFPFNGSSSNSSNSSSAQSNVGKATKYKVEVKTGDIRGSGTDANVFINIHGENISTGKRLLDNMYNNFESGKTDEFLIESIDVGDIKTITIGHDNTGVGPGWFLDWVLITNNTDSKQYKFPACLWFAVDEDDGKIERKLNVSDEDLATGGGNYEIRVVTGDRRGAGTDANVAIQIFGSKGSSRNIKLSNSENNFERGKTDVFSLTSRDLGTLKKIRIGHDNSGFSAGWYLEKAIIKNLKSNEEWFFLAGRWLATDEGDGSTEIEVPATTADGTCGSPIITYKISVYTGDRPGAGTDANVFICLFGDQGDSGDRKLENDLDNFERNKIDVFSVQCVDLGKLSKIRIRTDGSGIGPSWFLDKVVVQSGGGDSWYFLHRKWLDKDHGLSAEIDGSQADGPPLLPMVTYKIEILTGDRRGAGTDANVFIELYGEKGKSARKHLDNSGNNFERNQTDTFGIEAIDLGKLLKIRIGHDKSGFGPAWFLERITITSEKSQEKWFFQCGDWLEGTKSERELPALDSEGNPSAPLTTYQIEVTTGDRPGAGTDANVFIVIYGDQGDSGKQKLEGPGNLFERKKTDVFGVECVELGKLKKIMIGHDNSGLGASWFLDKIVITNQTTKEQWFFLHGRWLSKDHEDQAIIREIPASTKDGQTCLPYVSYTVSIVTGDPRGAGTDANVFITIFGKNGDSGDRQLANSGNNFERKQTDVFRIESVDLGDLERIVIRHDNTGFGASWFLDKVVVQSGKGERWYFPCGQWLSDSEGDRQIQRELGAVKEDVTTYNPLVLYKVEVLTGDRPGAGTDANVTIDLYGDKGRSGLKPLDNSADNFERNHTDTFGVETAELGKLIKINIGHDNSGIGASWFLDKVIVTSEKTQEKFYFLCGDWLEGKNNRKELSASDKDGNSYQPLVKYTIDIITGDRPGAGTDANVFITVYGSTSDSGKRILDGPGNLFERKKTDSFVIQCVDLGDLKKILIGHDDSGFGSSWFLEKVTITNQTSNQQWFFFSGKWLSKDHGDKAIVREILGSQQDTQCSIPLAHYRIKVMTGDVPGAGTDADVFLTIYGKSGDSGERILDNSLNNFERGKTDVFGIESVDLGDLERVTIRHNNKGISAGWFLDKVIITHSDGREWFFPCGKWLAADQDDKQISRDLMATKQDQITYSPFIFYKITVLTGDRPGAGTKSKVFLTLIGAKAESPEQQLDGGSESFGRKGEDEFGIECLPLGELKKIRIRIADSIFGSSWFLDKLIVYSEKDKKSWFFLSGSWLNKKEGLTKEIPASDKDGKSYSPMAKYSVSVITGNCRGAGTDANMFVCLYGDQGDSGRRTLEGPGNLFERGQTDVFQIECVAIGELKKIRIGHDGSGLGAGWFCDKVIVEDDKGKKLTFPCNKWFDSGKGDGQIERDLTIDGKPGLGIVNYRLTVKTGDVSGAGTDANVFISLFGAQGKVEKVRLENAKDNFEQGRLDVFTIESEDVGDITSVLIGHDAKGVGSGWFLDVIFISNESTKKRWMFPCYRWLDTKEDDKQIERTLVPGGLKNLYEIRVLTGNDKGAGTDANVHCQLTGKKGKSTLYKLDDSKTHKNKFEQGNTDIFIVEGQDIGELTNLTIGHDNKGSGASWQVEKVNIFDYVTGSEYEFLCNQWFDKKMGDGLLERNLPVTSTSTF